MSAKETTTTKATETSSWSSVEDLSALLAALASGAKAVNNLPFHDDFEYEKSFPEFAQLHGECRHAVLSILNDLDLLDNNENRDFDLDFDNTAGGVDYDDDIDDPLVWEKCADACDLWMERVEGYLATTSTRSPSSSASEQQTKLQQLSDKAHQVVKGKLQTMVKALVDMEKPQDRFHIQPQNDRTEPFIPQLHPQVQVQVKQQDGHGLESRFGSFRTCMVSPNVIAPSTHALHPYQNVIESFQYQDWQLQVVDSDKTKQTNPKELKSNNSLKDAAIWIDTESELAKLIKQLQDEHVQEIAIDLEAHSYRSFSGFICLMQLSYKSSSSSSSDDNDDKETTTTIHDYLIDTLALWHCMNQYMAPIFCNPSICKIMHGADSDVQWLQRDFSIYIVNLFDTGRAARLLQLPSAGYAYALLKYKNVQADKTHQLSDWRQRPLPTAMKVYATMDTHYLLDVYECMKYELYNHPNKDVSIEAVLDASRQVCLIRYDKEPFNPQGYKAIMASSKRRQRQQQQQRRRTEMKSDLLPHQEQTLANLWDWRDRTARHQDESTQYVCPNPSLLRLALVSPTNVTTLQSCVNPMPPLVLHYAQDVLDCIVTKQHHQDVGLSTTTTTTTATTTTTTPGGDEKVGDNNAARAGILSPVMGTEALYKEAGWMTPSSSSQSKQRLLEQAEEIADDDEMVGVTATTTDDDDDAEYDPTRNKPKHLLMVDSANKDFRSAQYTGHSLEMGGSNKIVTATTTAGSKQEDSSLDNSKGRDITPKRGRVVDGLGSARATIQTFVNNKNNEDREQDGSTDEPSLKEESEQAQQTAKDIRTAMSRKDNLVSMMPTQQQGEDDYELDDETMQGNNDNSASKNNDNNDDDNEDFEIPKSMRDIYKISNRNRRKNKKATLSPSRQKSNGSTDGDDTGTGGVTNNDDGNVVMKDEEDRMDVDTLEGAEVVLASRGYFTTEAKRQRTKSEASADSSEVVENNNTTSNKATAGKDGDIAFMQEIGWIKNKEDANALLQKQEAVQQDQVEQQGGKGTSVRNNEVKPPERSSATAAPAPAAASFDYSNVDAMGVYNPNAPAAANPFFSGAAIAGVTLTQGSGSQKSCSGVGKGGPKKTLNGKDSKPVRSSKQERPEKKEGRTVVYKKN